MDDLVREWNIYVNNKVVGSVFATDYPMAMAAALRSFALRSSDAINAKLKGLSLFSFSLFT